MKDNFIRVLLMYLPLMILGAFFTYVTLEIIFG